MTGSTIDSISTERLATSARLLLALIVGSFAVSAAIAFGFGMTAGMIDNDAGFYVPIARLILLGLTPVADFPTSYTPGIGYFLALFGNGTLHDPVGTKLVIYAVELANALLVGVLAAHLGQPRLRATALAMTYLVWVLGLQGEQIYLEPLLVLFTLLCALLLIGTRSLASTIAAGAFLGCAMMIKQYAIVAFPGLLLLLFSRPPVSSNMEGSESAGPKVLLRHMLHAIALSFSIGVPFLAFALLTQQNPVEMFVHFATFGGNAASYAESRSNVAALLIGNASNADFLVFPILASGTWLLLVDRSRLSWALVALAWLSLAPLAVREFPHYVQIAAPWGILLMARLIERISTAAGLGNAARNALLAVAIFPFIRFAFVAIDGAHSAHSQQTLHHQQVIVSSIEKTLREGDSVAAVALPWFFFFSDFRPPDLDYSFVGFTENPRRARERIAKADAVIVNIAKWPDYLSRPFWPVEGAPPLTKIVGSGVFRVAIHLRPR